MHRTPRQSRFAAASLALHAGAILFALGRLAEAQVTWTQRPLPEGRVEHAIAHDPTRGHTLLFGGRGAAGVLADTWEWDGAAWHRLLPAYSPHARAGHA